VSLSESSDPVAIYNSRIKSRQIILENPVRQSKAKQQRDDKRAKKAAEKAKKKAGIMGRRGASEKGTWKLEKEQTKYVSGSVAFPKYLKKWLIIRFLFQVSPLLAITSSLAWLHVRTPWPCPFSASLYCRTSHACGCEHARKIGQS
jgi:hypothetical protein